MVSENRKQPSKAELFQLEMQQLTKEAMTQIKMENSFLCFKNIELENELKELKLYQDSMLVQIQFFKGMDMKKVAEQQKLINELQSEQEQLQ